MEEEDLAHQAQEKGAYMVEKIQSAAFANVREVRGMGLMIGVELKQKVAPVLKALQERRIIALNAGMTVLRLLPPLVITYPQIDQVVAALQDVLTMETAGA
jgi:acetylornithine/LysW-gamma-L-lysine aminotransferase